MRLRMILTVFFNGTFVNNETTSSEINMYSLFPNGLSIYRKHTQTGQYVTIDSFTLCKWKVSRICFLVSRPKRICSDNCLNKEIQLIKKYAAWNGYRKCIFNSIVKRALRVKSQIISQKKVPQILRRFLWI